jgi:ankyrin repeat protein
MVIEPDDPLAVALTGAIRSGAIKALRALLAEHPELATTWVRDGSSQRSPLHVATDWPGKFPNNSQVLTVLIDAGADVNARFVGAHQETPLHWAASNNDLDAIELLLDAGADIDAGGGVIDSSTPLADAVAFSQWKAAKLLVDRGARVGLWQAAAMGMIGRVVECIIEESPDAKALTNAFWCACHGGSQLTAEYLLALDAEINWIGHDHLTPLDAAERERYTEQEPYTELIDWLRSMGARKATELV